jgi:hypothetical protein
LLLQEYTCEQNCCFFIKRPIKTHEKYRQSRLTSI